MLELLVGRRTRYQQSILVSDGESAHKTGASNGRRDDGDDVAELGLEYGEEVG